MVSDGYAQYREPAVALTGDHIRHAATLNYLTGFWCRCGTNAL